MRIYCYTLKILAIFGYVTSVLDERTGCSREENARLVLLNRFDAQFAFVAFKISATDKRDSQLLPAVRPSTSSTGGRPMQIFFRCSVLPRGPGREPHHGLLEARLSSKQPLRPSQGAKRRFPAEMQRVLQRRFPAVSVSRYHCR